MRMILTIARKEIRSTFVTPTGYVLIAGFLVISGFFFFGLLLYYNSNLLPSIQHGDSTPTLNEWVVYQFYKILELISVFFVPLLSMRAVSEEKSRGTFELLLTSPLKTSDLTFGKFLGLAIVVLFMLLLSFVYPLVLILFTDVEVKPIYVGLLGMFLFALSFAALGLACSAATRSQTVAGVIALILSLLIYVIDMPAGKVGDTLSELLHYLSPSAHTEFLFKGVIYGADLLYFISFIAVGLFITNRVLDGERWRGI